MMLVFFEVIELSVSFMLLISVLVETVVDSMEAIKQTVFR